VWRNCDRPQQLKIGQVFLLSLLLPYSMPLCHRLDHLGRPQPISSKVEKIPPGTNLSLRNFLNIYFTFKQHTKVHNDFYLFLNRTYMALLEGSVTDLQSVTRGSGEKLI
jgi:hypothetical protein